MSFLVAKVLGGSRRLQVKAGVVAAVGCYVLNKSMFHVDFGDKALVYHEGINFLIPWVEKPIIYDLRSKEFYKEGRYTSRDRKWVNCGIHVLSRPKGDMLPTLHRTYGQNYPKLIISSITRETVWEVVARYDARQLITKREDFDRDIRETLAGKADKFDIQLFNVSVARAELSKLKRVREFNKP